MTAIAPWLLHGVRGRLGSKGKRKKVVPRTDASKAFPLLSDWD